MGARTGQLAPARQVGPVPFALVPGPAAAWADGPTGDCGPAADDPAGRTRAMSTRDPQWRLTRSTGQARHGTADKLHVSISTSPFLPRGGRLASRHVRERARQLPFPAIR